MDFSKFNEEVNYLKDELKTKYFSTTLVETCIKIILNKQFAQKIVEHTVPKRELFIVLQYLGMSSPCLRTCLQKRINRNISFCNIIFKSSKQLHAFFMSNTFISNARLKLTRNQANAKQHPEAKLLLFQNYSYSSYTLSSKNKRT